MATSVLTPWRAVFAGALVAVVVAASVSRTIPFDSDEANHANLALRQWQDLRDGELLDFLRHSYRTGQFPFLHGWTVVPFLAALGETEFAARVAQCLHFVVGCGATAWAAFRASGNDRRAGGIAGALFAFSPLLAAFAGLCMLETPGAAATAFSLAVFAEAVRAEGRRAAWLDAATAAAVLATWFTKLNYGIWILPAVALGYLVAALGALPRRRALAGLARYLGVLVVVLGAWYSTAEARAAFHGFLTNPAQAVSVVEADPAFRPPAFLPDNFLAYFPLVAGEFHLHWAVGAAVLLLAAWGAIRCMRTRNPAVAAAVSCVGGTWLTLSFGFREYPMARFIAPAMPALWITAAVAAAPFVARVAARGTYLVAERVLLLGGLVAQVFVVQGVLAREYETDARFRPVFDHLVERLPAPASVMVVNYTDHVSVRTLAWELATRPGGTYRDFDVKGLVAERVYEEPAHLDRWLDDGPRPWGDPSWGGWIVEMVPEEDYADREVLVPETVRTWREAVARRAPGRLELESSARFPSVGLTVRLWKDLRPPPHSGSR